VIPVLPALRAVVAALAAMVALVVLRVLLVACPRLRVRRALMVTAAMVVRLAAVAMVVPVSTV